MVLTLVSLVILLIAVAAMLRSVDTASMMAGNLAFRRDLANFADQGIVIAKAQLGTGGALNDSTVRQTDQTSTVIHYSASRLPIAAGATNGIPALLLDENAYKAKYGDPTTDPTSQITLRYIVDRQCVGTGAFDTSVCEFVTVQGDLGGTGSAHKPTGSSQAVYRISIRVTGPRNTEAFFQSIYAD